MSLASWQVVEDEEGSAAAAKYVLELIFMDDLFDQLLYILDDLGKVGSICGDPLWFIDRRDRLFDGEPESEWPAEAIFRITADPVDVRLRHSVCYLRRVDFHDLVKSCLSYFKAPDSNKIEQWREIEKMVSVPLE